MIVRMQGVALGLEALAAAGSQMVGTSQGGRREVTRHEAFRNESGTMTDQPAFRKYLDGVRKEGARLCMLFCLNKGQRDRVYEFLSFECICHD